MARSEVAPKAVLLDIEGTTTPIEFVTATLFPYARQRGREFILDHAADEEIHAALSELQMENLSDRELGAPPIDAAAQGAIEATIRYYLWLIDVDRKSTGLKTIQGRIWQDGYSKGDLRSAIFPDVAPALKRWREAGIKVAIYSSGSVLAQQLLFRHTPEGDLTPFIDAYFDTRIGAKKQAGSYRNIADELKLRPDEIFFISDVPAELEAAAAIGMRTALSVRTPYPVVCSFDGLF